MPTATQHLRHLADTIGPRPATTDAEAEAADYIEAVFRFHAVDVERQEFDSPRTSSWAFALYHTLTIGAAVASGWPALAWVAFVVAALVAFFLQMDLDTRFGLSGWLPPKGPSQNVIARHMPRVRRGERPTRVVIVAHYDSAKASLAASPSMAKNFSAMSALTRGCTFAVPILILLGALPFAETWHPWLWYLTIAASAYLAVPLLINLHREVAMSFTDGANGNASGVSVMLDVLGRIVPLMEDVGTGAFPRVRHDAAAAREAGVVPEGAAIEYTDEHESTEDVTALPDDFRWAEAPATPARESREGAQGILSLDTDDFEPVAPMTERPAPTAPFVDEEVMSRAGEAEPTGESRPYDFGEPESAEPGSERRGSRLRNLFGRRKKNNGDEGLGGWLGVGKGFDAREEGRKIGSWENLGDDEDDDDFGYKGGRAGDDPIGDPDYAAAEASRIRRRVTESVDRALADKEIWFVATGSGEVGGLGMKALLAAYPEEMKRALIINLDTLGAGTLHMITEEGVASRYRSDRRLLSAGKRIAVESDLPVRTRAYRGPSTDTAVALARRRRAMSLMAFDVNGRRPNSHWNTDTVENVSEENLENAARFVTELVRAL